MTASPPSCLIASSKVRRVRSEGFSNSRLKIAPREGLRESRGVRLICAARSQQMPQRFDGQIHIGEQMPGKRLGEFAKGRGHGGPPD